MKEEIPSLNLICRILLTTRLYDKTLAILSTVSVGFEIMHFILVVMHYNEADIHIKYSYTFIIY
jgi:hypothetical protein